MASKYIIVLMKNSQSFSTSEKQNYEMRYCFILNSKLADLLCIPAPSYIHSVLNSPTFEAFC